MWIYVIRKYTQGFIPSKGFADFRHASQFLINLEAPKDKHRKETGHDCLPSGSRRFPFSLGILDSWENRHLAMWCYSVHMFLIDKLGYVWICYIYIVFPCISLKKTVALNSPNFRPFIATFGRFGAFLDLNSFTSVCIFRTCSCHPSCSKPQRISKDAKKASVATRPWWKWGLCGCFRK